MNGNITNSTFSSVKPGPAHYIFLFICLIQMENAALADVLLTEKEYIHVITE